MSKDFSEELKKLSTSTLVVTFTKKNGEERRMVCTTNMKKIPSEFHPKGTGHEKTGVMSVFDLEKQEWRSFRLDSIISVEELKS